MFTIAKMKKKLKCPPTDEWVKKMWCVCVYIYTHTHTYTYTHTHTPWNITQPQKRVNILPFAAVHRWSWKVLC